VPFAPGSHQTSGSNIARLIIRVSASPVAPGSSVSGGAEMPIVSVPPVFAWPAEPDGEALEPQAASSGDSPRPAATVAPRPSSSRRETKAACAPDGPDAGGWPGIG